MQTIESLIVRWRTQQIVKGVPIDIVDELESHLLESLDELCEKHDVETAFKIANEKLGNPIDAFSGREPWPLNALLAIAYIWFIGVSLVLNEAFLLANGKFDLLAALFGLLVCNAAYKISKASYQWLLVWIVFSWGMVVTLLLFFCGYRSSD